MKILIVEDESRSAKRLERLLRKEIVDPRLEIFLEQSVNTGLQFIETFAIDLLFLDLNLKGQDGFDLLQQIVSNSFHTIIVSAYAERAIEAFGFGVLDFVPKPISPKRLNQAISRFYEQNRTSNLTKYLSVRHRNNIELIVVENIIYLQSKDHYSEVHNKDGTVRLHTKSLEKLLAILPPEFERTHKSYIVNMNFVKKIQSFSGSTYKLELTNAEILPMGRSRTRNIKEKLV